MIKHKHILEQELRHRGASTSKELAASLGVSQPTMSRVLSQLEGRGLLRIGRARSTRYAMPRPIPPAGSEWPLYEIDQKGNPSLSGNLHSLETGQWLLQQEEPWETLRWGEFPDGLYPGFPWFLEDLRPQGFLGRLFARTHGRLLGLSEDPRQWTDGGVTIALVRHGHDLQGSFILGGDMLSQFQKNAASGAEAIPLRQRGVEYAALAESVLSDGWPGSSAAGEQPKFATRVAAANDAVRHVIVKFSGKGGRPEDQRWSDLLAAEHVAAIVLVQNAFPAARTEIVDANGRRFLESERFDRIGAHGRRGLVSLAALDSAYFGRMDTPWTTAASRLLRSGWLTREDAERLETLWWFGKLIGNTDMHYGNISMFLEKTRPLTLAPSYDMLPMLYRPDAEGGLPPLSLVPEPSPPEALPNWSKAAGMAAQYWSTLASHPLVSESFNRIAEENATNITASLKNSGG